MEYSTIIKMKELDVCQDRKNSKITTRNKKVAQCYFQYIIYVNTHKKTNPKSIVKYECRLEESIPISQ